MRVEWLSQEKLWEDGFRLLLERLFLLIYRVAGPLEPLAHPRRIKLHEVRLRAHQTLDQPWTLEDMARLAGLGRSRFAALYAKLFGIPPLRDLLLARVAAAKQHLRDEELSIAEVATQSGFFDCYYFTRCFRKLVGQSPSQYRKSRGFSPARER